LANTAEPLFLLNRTGNRPSHEQADVYLNKAIDLCRRAGFRKILMRGDTKFTQTRYLDRWDEAGDVRFLSGLLPLAARATLIAALGSWVYIEAVAMDMSAAYRKAVSTHLPGAVNHFHVVKLFNEKRSDLRRALHREAT
jgi:hypothetical protein